MSNSQNYYEDQFGQRIGQIAKPGASPPNSGESSGKSGWGCGGGFGIFAVLIVIRLILIGSRTNRDGIGARVEVVAGARTIVRQRKGGCSMQSTNDPRLLIGLGNAEVVTRVAVRVYDVFNGDRAAHTLRERLRRKLRRHVFQPLQIGR